jgi:hypothetical protein
MKRNVGGADRGARLVIGFLLIAIPIFVELPGWWGVVPFIIGVILVATALLRYCPVNAALGFDTRRA